MTKKKPFEKENTTKIPFEELIGLIDKKCDYKFAINYFTLFETFYKHSNFFLSIYSIIINYANFQFKNFFFVVFLPSNFLKKKA